MGRALVACVLVLWACPAVAGQGAGVAVDEDLSIQAFLQAVETAISTADRTRWTALLSSTGDRDQALEFFDAMIPQGVTRAVIRERDRQPLPGTLPGEGHRLLAEVFIETGPRGRIATWRLDVRRPRGSDDDPQPWRVSGHDRLTSIEGLHRLSLHPEKQFAARNLDISSVDFRLHLPAGDVFVAETAEGVTALVLLGEGTMIFTPAPPEERGQVKLFAGAESLETPFTAALVRVNPWDLDQRLDPAALVPVPYDSRAARRAAALFDDEVARSYSLDLSDLSRDTWSLLPQAGDFLAEVRTRRFSTLTYARSTGEAEDVSLFQRARRKNIAVYASPQKLASRGRHYDESDLAEYDIVEYDVDAAFSPDREWLDGRTRLKLRVKAFALAALTLKLADTLTVNSISSDQFGRLLFLRVRNQNSLVVNLPSPVARDFEITLHVSYQGRIERQPIDQESLQEQRGRPVVGEDIPILPPEPNWLLSNRSQWYPQGSVTDYATATLRVTVPAEYTVVGSGAPAGVTPADPAPGSRAARSTFTLQAVQPLRYLTVVVSRMNPVDAATVALDIVPRDGAAGGDPVVPGVPAIGERNTTSLAVHANRRQEARGRTAFDVAVDVLRFYAALVGDVPYEALTLAMVENYLPGGHSPAYAVMINNALPTMPYVWRSDPAVFRGFPEFFVAHEVAHQWWGQAVGWKNYREQWLSEGFAQYFSALYARERRGEQAFVDMLRQFRRTSMEQTGQGPVSLGYRLGHLRSDSRVFRSLVYNKGASVLHMLRRLVGDDAFFRGFRRYYRENRFRKAGTVDLQRAMESEAGRPLDRFFQRWIFEDALPRVRYHWAIDGQDIVVRFEQQDGQIFDVPVTVTLGYGDRDVEEVVRLTDAIVEVRFPLAGTLRGVDVNDDHGALGVFERK